MRIFFKQKSQDMCERLPISVVENKKLYLLVIIIGVKIKRYY